VNVNSLKSWKEDGGFLVSARFSSKGTLDQSKKFLIRNGLHAECDDRNLVIKLPLKGESGKANLATLKKMEIL
jgi:hypothetical protein